MLKFLVVVALADGLVVAPPRIERARPLKGLFDKFKNPFDDRPGATVGLLQVALLNDDAKTTKFVGDAARKLDSSSSRGLSRFVEGICNGLSRRSNDWMYAHCASTYFGPGSCERSEHERYYNRVVNTEAVKFDKEYLPTSADLAKAATSDKTALGYCVVSLVIALEGDLRDIFDASSITDLRQSFSDVAAAATVDAGDALYNAEVLWTPSSPDESLFREDLLLDFPELSKI